MDKYKKITIKIGSNIITSATGKLNVRLLRHITSQIAEMKKKGIEIILVSSGAVSTGKKIIQVDKKQDTIANRQLYSAVGQIKLINKYASLFKKHNIICAQILVTTDDFKSRKHYLNMRNCIDSLLDNNIVPIVNENDVTSVTELMFTDNDELSGLIAAMMNSEALIILTNVDGIYDKNASVIKKVEKNDKETPTYISTQKSNFGRGGMITKFNIAKKVASQGINVHIANGGGKHMIKNLLNTKNNDTVNTWFVPDKKKSPIKKWIAHSENYTKGEIYINTGAKESLFSPIATSLLFIGILKIKGEFQKDDIVRIFDDKNKYIGLGRVKYSSITTLKKIGQKNSKPLIHYDYLYINN